MYFEINQVNDTLLCQHCKGRLDIPKILPCGETICSFCVSSLKVVDKIFDCVACKQKHEMPKDGLLNNIALLKILSIKPTKISHKLNEPIKIKWSRYNGIYCEKSHGPAFGGHDLIIADKSNTNTISYSNIGHSYTHPDYAYGSNEANLFLAGSNKFQVSEIEVYAKQ